MTGIGAPTLRRYPTAGNPQTQGTQEKWGSDSLIPVQPVGPARVA